ncbi:hypothetical protein KC356_g8906 [Hortaea werneckii]|nr:hypothetical protein KC356_g8906 [Hortaea werneckii]
MEEILPYGMLEDCQYETDEDEIKVYEEMLVALVEGRIDVATAARQITDALCDEVMRERRLSRSHWSGVDKACSQEQARWRNLSFFFARLTTEGIADLAHMSALFMLQPEQQLPKTRSAWSGYLAAQASAAAQWIVPKGHGAWIWQQCRTNTQTTSVELFQWTVEHWNQWEEAFTELVGLHDDPNVPEIARELSSTALEVMGHLESDDPVA